MKVLIAGISIRNIAASAKRSGHEVVAADCYCDLDLSTSSVERLSFTALEDGSLRLNLYDRLLDLLIDKHRPDAVVLGPGLEETEVKAPIVLNNSPSKIALISDKLWLARWLESHGYPGIPTWPYGFCDSCERVVVKPRKGAGGIGVRMAAKNDENEDSCAGSEMIAQEWTPGIPASVSVISTGHEAVAVSVNEQLIGASWLAGEQFRYCGNIVPLDSSLAGKDAASQMASIAQDLVLDLKLIGSNGVDFIAGDRGPVVVEVNPRFQGSLDAVEMSLERSIFQYHLNAFRGCLPTRILNCRHAGRAVLYAQQDVLIKDDLRMHVNGLVDVPRPVTSIACGQPVTSILSRGEGRLGVMRSLQRRARELTGLLYR